MRTNSLNNSFSLLNYKNLNSIGRYVATIAAVLMAWVNIGVTAAATFNASLTGSAGTGGRILLANTDTRPDDYDGGELTVSGSSGAYITFYAWAVPNDGYYWSSWSTTKGKGTIDLATPNTSTQQGVKCAAGTLKSADKSSGINWGIADGRVRTNVYTVTANFAAIQVKSYGGNEDL